MAGRKKKASSHLPAELSAELPPALLQAQEQLLAGGPELLLQFTNTLVQRLQEDPKWLDFLQSVTEELSREIQSPDQLDNDFMIVPSERTPRDDQYYTAKITLKGSTPTITRTLEIPDMTFGELHDVIQIAFGWTNSHLHGFCIGRDRIINGHAYDDGFGGIPMFEEESDGEDEDDVCLSDLTDKERGKIVYTYDFGDSWDHEVKLSAPKPLRPGVAYPRCTAGARACPPEDCGGIWGYEELCEILQTPAAERNADESEQVAWLDKFDPEAFSIETVNKNLADFYAPPPPKAKAKAKPKGKSKK